MHILLLFVCLTLCATPLLAQSKTKKERAITLQINEQYKSELKEAATKTEKKWKSFTKDVSKDVKKHSKKGKRKLKKWKIKKRKAEE